jgi:hypothetical protein
LICLLKKKKLLKLFTLAAVCLIIVGVILLSNKDKVIDTLRIGTEVYEIELPEEVLLFERGNIGKPFAIEGTVGIRADKVQLAMISRSHQAEEFNWTDLTKHSGYPATFSGAFNLPEEPSILFVRSQRKHSARLGNPILIRPALIFVVAGQSNAAGGSDHLFISPSENGYFGDSGKHGISWRPGHDPDAIRGLGSVWPLVGDYFRNNFACAVGIINITIGGSSILEWQPGSEAFSHLITALKLTKETGFKAVLWHQGESDHKLTADRYQSSLENLISESRTASDLKSMPWLVATASLNGTEISESVREGQLNTLNTANNIFPGPDTDVLNGENRDSLAHVHFTKTGTELAATLWIKSIEDFLENQPAHK